MRLLKVGNGAWMYGTTDLWMDTKKNRCVQGSTYDYTNGHWDG